MPNIWTRLTSFFAPQAKVNPAMQGYTVVSDMPQASRMYSNYAAYAKEGYRGSDSVYKCISYIARNGAAISPKLYTDASKQEEIESHPLLDKLNSPNPEQSGVAYREAVLGFKLLAGNAYQYAIRSGIRAPDELWPLRPDFVEIIPNRQRGIVGYKYEHIERPILPENIGHTKYWHPDDDFYGLSPLEVAAIMVDQQKAAKTWNLALLQNSARPPGAWSTPALLSKNDRDRLEEKLNQKFAGAKNAGKFPVLDGGLTWQSIALPPAQMAYLDMLKYNGGSIANIYNIPPQLIGDTSASTYDNMEQAKIASYTEAIFPELDDLYALWNMWLVPMYSDLRNAYLYYDKESVEVIQAMIQAQKTAKAERADKMWINGVATLNEARRLHGLPDVAYGEVH